MSTSAEQLARDILARMSLEHKVGQVFMLGFEGTVLDAANRALLTDLRLGGVTLFARNIASGQQVAQLTADLQRAAGRVPLFIAVDQEGGLVVRVTRGATVFPGNMAVGATGDPTLARRIGEASALELRAMGVNMDLGPVVDVNTNPRNPVIGVRAFGSRVELVDQFAVEAITSRQSSGVSAVAKHFPGHGDTSIDSHRDLPVVPHALSRLQAIELRPFQAAIRAGVDGIMTAHVAVPAIESRPDVPATLSSRVLSGLLRQRLGYTGLILTDALDMQAITRERELAQASVQAFEAGADLLLIAGTDAQVRRRAAEAPSMLLAAVRAGRISEARLDASVVRILSTKARRGVGRRPDPSVLAGEAHRALALDVARRAVTLHRDDARLLPLDRAARILVVEPPSLTSDVVDDVLDASLLNAVRRRAPAAVGVEWQAAAAAAPSADVIVLATFDLVRDEQQQRLAADLGASGTPVVGVSLRGPYDASVAPRIGTWLTVYGDRPVHLQAAAEALFGLLTPLGRIP
jgi:beta-N-acetylhexosaminidase